jgi:hypothetical protein
MSRDAAGDRVECEIRQALLLDREQNPIDVRLAAVEELAHLEGEFAMFGSQWTAMRMFRERLYGLPHVTEPVQTGFAGLERLEPFEDGI